MSLDVHSLLAESRDVGLGFPTGAWRPSTGDDSRGERLAGSAMAYVLAGGRGSRLQELTDRRSKPAVPFGGKSRIIDFTLSNALNSGIRHIAVATQYKSQSLIRHLRSVWNFVCAERDESFDILPSSQRVREGGWYAGTADAVYQNIDIIERYKPQHVLILAGDHVYKMDYEAMLQQHVEQDADLTVGCLEVPADEASNFGIMQADENDRILSFVEKPKSPPLMPGMPNRALASMGIYVFNAEFLFDQLRRDAVDPDSSRDFGKDVVPYVVRHGKAVAHHFSQSCVRSDETSDAYWRDVGTLDAYWSASLDLTDAVPQLDLFDAHWPIWTFAEKGTPAKFAFAQNNRRGEAVSSLISAGCSISGATVRHSLLLAGCRLQSNAHVENSVLLPEAKVGRSARLKNVIVDRGVKIPAGLVVGEEPERDAQRFRRTGRGVCLITQPMIDRLA